MTGKRGTSDTQKSLHKGALNSSGATKQTITPAERWLLISERAYGRIQARGFVGGDPFEDWKAAEQEVDAMYDTDTRIPFVQSDAEQLVEQVRQVFGGYSLGHLGLNAILERHRAVVQALASHNSRVMQSTSELVLQQNALFREAVNQAIDSLRSFSEGEVSAEGFVKQAELSKRALQNLLTYFNGLSESVADMSALKKRDDKGD